MKREALFYKNKGSLIECNLCPHNCIIKENGAGVCGVRRVRDGVLRSLNYGEISSVSIDPIEKKPLYHYKPGSKILSVGSFGCNFSCGFCQNYSISKDTPPTQYVDPEELILLARDSMDRGNIGIAFTYNEPSIWYEYIYDVAKLKDDKTKIILVTNGFINIEPLKELLPFIDAMNIDLKAFNDDYYRKVCGGNLNSVLDVIEASSSYCHVEVTTLLVNGYNDSTDEVEKIATWIANINKEIPLHFSRYYPTYKFTAPPTPVETVNRAREAALKHLDYVYTGNISGDGNNTYCPECNALVIDREGYKVEVKLKDNLCPNCGKYINVIL